MAQDKATSEQVEGLEFKPADGGAISETRLRGKDKYGPSFSHKTAVHATLAHAVNHLKKHIGPSFGKKEKSAGMKKA